MKVLNRIAIYIFIIMIVSCQDNVKIEHGKFRHYNLGHKEWKVIKHDEKIGTIKYTAAEIPLSYYVSKEIGMDNPSRIDSIVNASKSQRIIEFEFVEDNSKELLDAEFTNLDYTKSLEYLSFNIQKDFQLVTNKDTVQCSGVIVERSYRVTPHQKILLFFTGVSTHDHVQLVYNDLLFGKGVIKFNINDNSAKLAL